MTEQMAISQTNIHECEVSFIGMSEIYHVEDIVKKIIMNLNLAQNDQIVFKNEENNIVISFAIPNALNISSAELILSIKNSIDEFKHELFSYEEKEKFTIEIRTNQIFEKSESSFVEAMNNNSNIFKSEQYSESETLFIYNISK